MKTEPTLKNPDDFYEQLLDAHRGLSAEQSAQLNARLILLLANQVGDLATVPHVLRDERGRAKAHRGDDD